MNAIDKYVDAVLHNVTAPQSERQRIEADLRAHLDEAMHALSLIASYVPETIEANLARLIELIQKDRSTIVRDYAVDAVGNYATVGPYAAERSYPLLKRALYGWESKQAKQALIGLGNASRHLPEKRAEICAYAEEFRGHKKGVVRKAAEAILRDLG